MFRAYQTILDSTGSGFVGISPFIQSVEWDIYQIAISTGIYLNTCTCQILLNGYFLCASQAGSLDSADGPPDIVVLPNDMLNIVWSKGTAGDTATAGIWYNENPEGTTYSSAH